MQTRTAGRSSGLAIALAAALIGVAASRAHAQTSSSIVGTVRDESGAALVGVTVEVSSPALIERTKVTVTGPDGSYRVVDLRPGEYTVTFSLDGFQRVRRESVQLSAAFTATVDAVLPIGQLGEEVTVRGDVRLIDTRSGTSEQPLRQQLLEGIPVGRIPNVAVLMIPGATSSRPDVGGSETGQTNNISIHGSLGRDLVWNTDGINMTSNTADGGVSGQYPNQGAYQEVVVQTRALPAEVGAGGVSVNLVSKDGGNTFRGDLFATYTGRSLQSGNVSDAQRELGLTAPSATDTFYDANIGLGGPIVRDKLWFYGSGRRFRIDRLEANTFNPDGSQALDDNLIWNATGKLTWQINPQHRLSTFVDYGHKLRSHRRTTTQQYQFISPEASSYSPLDGPMTTIKLTSTLRPTLLLESGFGWYYVPWSLDYQPGLDPAAFPRNDLARSTLEGASAPAMTLASQERRTWSAVASYLPTWRGSHQLKFGFQFEHAPYRQDYDSLGHGDFIARYRNGVPDSVLVYNTPVRASIDQYELALFVQDSWTLAHRVTVNAGARYERHIGSLDAQTAPAGQFVGERRFDAQPGVIVWNNLVPRLSVAWDLFGTGRTVLKGSVSQFTQRQGSALVNQLNPMRLNSEVRTWNDANGDLVPQLHEIGPGQGALDRGANVRVADDLRRPTQWEVTASLEHQLSENLAVTLSYFRRRYSDLYAVVNVAVTADDYTPLSIVNPLDGRPLTIYSQNADSIGRVDNVLLNSDRLTQSYDGGEITVTRRFTDGITVFGGVTIGSNKSSSSASLNPNDQINAYGYDPLDSRVMVNTSAIAPLPGGFSFSSRFAHYSGQPLRRIYQLTRTIVPELGQTSQDVQLAPRGEYRRPDQTLWDVRVGRRFQGLRGTTIEPLFEIYNLLNENASLTEVETVGPSLGRISRNIDGRLLRFSVRVSF
ncbi:MAG TPA: TonB-dependent receptor [Vicinamibacterales bacterium]